MSDFSSTALLSGSSPGIPILASRLSWIGIDWCSRCRYSGRDYSRAVIWTDVLEVSVNERRDGLLCGKGERTVAPYTPSLFGNTFRAQHSGEFCVFFFLVHLRPSVCYRPLKVEKIRNIVIHGRIVLLAEECSQGWQ